MEGLVVVSYAKRGVGNGLTQNQGQRGFILTVELYLTMVSIIP